jgi:hypothetical protein
LYSPGGISSKEYVPVELAVCDLERFVSRFVMVIVAPPTTAPVASVIVPRIVEVPNCAHTQLGKQRIITRARKLHWIVDRFIKPLLSSID